jgi:hypothetical protein
LETASRPWPEQRAAWDKVCKQVDNMNQIKIVFCLILGCATATASQISAADQATVGTAAQTQRQQPAAPNPVSLPGAESRVYKTIGEVKLYLHVFRSCLYRKFRLGEEETIL